LPCELWVFGRLRSVRGSAGVLSVPCTHWEPGGGDSELGEELWGEFK